MTAAIRNNLKTVWQTLFGLVCFVLAYVMNGFVGDILCKELLSTQMPIRQLKHGIL